MPQCFSALGDDLILRKTIVNTYIGPFGPDTKQSIPIRCLIDRAKHTETGTIRRVGWA